MKVKKIVSSALTLGLVISSIGVSSANVIDIDNHWAEETIIEFMDNGYIKGYPDGTFKPNNGMTRAEFVSMFNRVFNLTNKSNQIFEDTKNHWAKDAIDIAVTNGVCNGISEDEFNPNGEVTREQVAVMISNYKKISDNNIDKINVFSDKGHISSWAEEGVEGALEKGYLGGYPDGSFKPTQSMTRAEVTVTLDRVIDPNYVPPKPEVPNQGISFDEFKDMLPGLGFKHLHEDTYGYFDESGWKYGIVRVTSDMIGLGLEYNSPSFDAAIKKSFNLLFPTQGDRLYEIVSNPFENQTLNIDGRTVTLKQFPQGVSINIYDK